MDEKDLNRMATDAEREIGEILKPQGGQFGTGAPPPPRPVMRTVETTRPAETPEPEKTPEAPPPLRTVSERLAELSDKLDMVEAKIDLMIAVLR